MKVAKCICFELVFFFVLFYRQFAVSFMMIICVFCNFAATHIDSFEIVAVKIVSSY